MNSLGINHLIVEKRLFHAFSAIFGADPQNYIMINLIITINNIKNVRLALGFCILTITKNVRRVRFSVALPENADFH